MKRYTYMLVLVVFSTMLALPAEAQIKRIGAVYVRGEITVDERSTEHVQIDIFQENKKVSSYTSDENGFFKLRLRFNHAYTIEFSKKGTLKKRIYFDTSMPERTMNVPEYEMFIDLVPEQYLDGVNTSPLEFPMAIISYDDELGEYRHNEKYTFHMEYIVTKLLAESAIKREMEEVKRN